MKQRTFLATKGMLLVISLACILFNNTAFSQDKFVGNIHSYYDDTNYTNYWNQVTPENAGKWSVCEPNRDQYNWSKLDQAYAFAKSKNIPFKQHTFVWGSQYPGWMDDLSESDQRAEVKEWIMDFAERYPDCDFIDVVNEPLPFHNPAPFKDALGGDGETGWDWVVTSFEWAREYCPNATLLLNDFGIIDNPDAANDLAEIANILNERGLIDGIGLQCHAFSMNGVGINTMNEVLDILSETGLPIYIAEMDMGGDETTQLNRYMEKFPVLYNHENVKGITLWGYRKNNMWIPDAWLYDEVNDIERPALKWLNSFLVDSEPGIIIPGRIDAEAYFRQNGTDTLNANDSIVLVNNINNQDWVNYVLNTLGEEEYDIDIKVSNTTNNTSVYIIIDDHYTDTIEVTEGMDTLSTSIYLEEGKHTFKLLFSNNLSEENLMEVDWIDVFGETVYLKLTASADSNGTLYPNGDVYVAYNDSVTFTFDANAGFKPDSIFVDETAYNSSTANFTLYNVTEEHTIFATFAECVGIELNPFYKLNNNAFENSSEVTAVELDTLTLKVEYSEEGSFYWLDKEGEQSFNEEFIIEGLTTKQAGEYGFYHSNTIGCKSSLNFNVSVDHIELDVYQAEDYLNQSGIETEDANDIGGGKNIGYIEDDDWCTYEIELDSAGVYDFKARAASETGGGYIKLSIDDEILGSLKVKASETNGWQDWYTTDPIEITMLNNGTQTIKLTFTGGSGYLFNLNWFNLTYKRPVSISKNKALTEVQVYPNPANDQLNIVSEFEIKHVNIFNLQGQNVYSKTINDKSSLLKFDLTEGLYMVHVFTNNETIVKKLVIQ